MMVAAGEKGDKVSRIPESPRDREETSEALCVPPLVKGVICCLQCAGLEGHGEGRRAAKAEGQEQMVQSGW